MGDGKWSSVRAGDEPDPPPPAGFPCGHMNALFDVRSLQKHREPRICVMVDHERGKLRFRVDNMPWATALGSCSSVGPLPPGAGLRPWVALTTRGDECLFIDPFTRLVC